MFNRQMMENLNYRLVGVNKDGIIHTGCYYKTIDGEYITSLLTGEKFNSDDSFVLSVQGYDARSPLMELMVYDEFENRWDPLYFHMKPDESVNSIWTDLVNTI